MLTFIIFQRDHYDCQFLQVLEQEDHFQFDILEANLVVHDILDGPSNSQLRRDLYFSLEEVHHLLTFE